jgi:hypothetical protein
MSLKANQVAAAIAAGVDRKIADGNNLYLVVKNGRGFWVVQYREGQKIRSKGLGSAANLSPAQARRAREDFVVRRRSENKSAGEEARRKGPASAPLLFGDAVEEFIIHRARVKNWKGGVSGAEADSYRRTLTRTSIAKVPLSLNFDRERACGAHNYAGRHSREDANENRMRSRLGEGDGLS